MENLESISRAILPLSLESKKHLLEILEQQIFELEEADYFDHSDDAGSSVVFCFEQLIRVNFEHILVDIDR